MKTHGDRHVRTGTEIEGVIADTIEYRGDLQHHAGCQAGRPPKALIAVAQGGVNKLDVILFHGV